MGKCIFCNDNDAKLSREHIWADWLTPYVTKDLINYEAGKVIVHRPGTPDHVTSKKIAGDPKSRRVKCVCVSCNTGWMKHIQDLAKPILVPMLEGKPALLGRKERRVVAPWIAMAVMCSEFGNDQLQAISQGDREILYSYKVPPRANWRIWIGRHERKASRTQWDHRALLIAPAIKVDQAAYAANPIYNTQSTTYTVGKIFIHVVSSDWPKCIRKFRIFPTGLVDELWPAVGAPLIWPPAHTLSDNEALQIAAGFFEGLKRAAGG